MEIMLIEDEGYAVYDIRTGFGRDMPEARITVVRSREEYADHAATRFDVYICDNRINYGCKAFDEILPDIWRRFPGAVLLHNSALHNEIEAEQREQEGGFRFARSPEGRIAFGIKVPGRLVEFLRTMVVDKTKSFKPPAQPLPAPAKEPRKA